MKDRVPTPGQEGRVKITPESGGAAYYAKLEMADNPTQAGDEPIKANLLPDDVATALGLTGNPQVKDALELINNNFTDPRKHWWGKYSVTGNMRGTFIDNVWGYSDDTYPADGMQGDYWYTYIGKNLVVAPIVEIFSYTGTGLYGVDNPTEITFDSPPKFFKILGYFNASRFNIVAGNGVNHQPFVICELLTTNYADAVRFGVSGAIKIKKSSDGKTISYWSSSGDAQINTAGNLYYGIVVR